MSLYLDTSVIVSFLAREPASERVLGWFEANAEEQLCISDWVTTEVASALSMKVRTGKLDLDARAIALSAFARLEAETFVRIGIRPHHFRAAARLVDNQALGLRAGDALHLAIASAEGLTLATVDKRLHASGPALGIATRLL